MIVQTHFDVNGRDFIRTISDEGRYVVRDGVEYSEACDPAELGRSYTEGNIIEDGGGSESAEAKALTRFANSFTGASNQDLISTAEMLIEQRIKEE